MAGWIRRTKIVATLGPNADRPGILRAMLQAGVDVARVNMSHGSHDEHAGRIARVRKEASALERPLAVLVDLSGPKLRTGEIGPGDPPTIVAGGEVWLAPPGGHMTSERIPVSMPQVLHDLRAGDRVLIDDGRIELRAEKADGDCWRCRIKIGGRLKAHAGLNLPETPLRIPSLTEKDRKDLAFALRQDADIVALSFVRKATDLIHLRELSSRGKHHPLLVAKIEKPEAMDRLDGIVKASDGVMVARGDLGVEYPAAEVPPAQKRILSSAMDHGRISITATQMLESMVASPIPTRAEASDVAHAVFDGTDAVMLSEETAVGKFPVEAVAAMAAIAARAEQSPYQFQVPVMNEEPGRSASLLTICRSAVLAAKDVGAPAILVFTRSGITAQVIAKLRPSVPIIAMSPEDATCHKLAMSWGVTPILTRRTERVEAVLRDGEAAIRKLGLARPGDYAVLVFGTFIASGTEHAMKVHRLAR